MQRVVRRPPAAGHLQFRAASRPLHVGSGPRLVANGPLRGAHAAQALASGQLAVCSG